MMLLYHVDLVKRLQFLPFNLCYDSHEKEVVAKFAFFGWSPVVKLKLPASF